MVSELQAAIDRRLGPLTVETSQYMERILAIYQATDDQKGLSKLLLAMQILEITPE